MPSVMRRVDRFLAVSTHTYTHTEVVLGTDGLREAVSIG